MTKTEYILGILDRLIGGYVNGEPYVLLNDVKYIIENLDFLDNKKD